MSNSREAKNISLTNILIIVIINISVLILLLYWIPQEYVIHIMGLYDNNSTLTDMHISIGNNLLIVYINVLYVTLTLALVTQSREAITQSKEAIIQSRKEQQIRDIENRLEKFYIPADDIINLKHRHRENTVNGYKRNTDGQFVQGLQHLRKHSYLANKATYEAYEKYMSEKCTTEKPITCQDIYKNLNFKECENHTYNCHHNWSTCPHNLEHCEYHPDHWKSGNSEHKDKNKCTLNNANCKYINDLKEKIEKDIEDYKNELLRLKDKTVN